jgi:hypothetical protein
MCISAGTTVSLVVHFDLLVYTLAELQLTSVTVQRFITVKIENVLLFPDF